MISKTMTFSEGPTSLKMIPEPMNRLPGLAVASDIRGVNTGAVGYQFDPLISATGEYLERLIGFMHITPDVEVDHDQIGPEMLAAGGALINTPWPKKLAVVRCINLIDGSDVPVPINFVSLGTRHNDEPLPNRDTSGFAVHHSLSIAMQTSLNEFVERQCIMRQWLENDGLRKVVNLPTNPVKEAMDSLGELEVYDLNATPFSGHCYFAVLLGKGMPVWFSSGLSFNQDPYAAYEKALNELWQIYLYVYGVAVGEINADTIIDPYQKGFLEYDCKETHAHFSNVIASNSFPPPDDARPIGNIICEAEKVTNQLYMYYRALWTGKELTYITKIFSPDFFMHIKPTARLNVINKFSATFRRINQQRLEMDLPFP